MAINKKVYVDQITIDDNGTVFVREVTQLVEDEVVLSQTYHRTSLTPGQDVSGHPENVQAICAAAWKFAEVQK